jgi:hypothetical protein
MDVAVAVDVVVLVDVEGVVGDAVTTFMVEVGGKVFVFISVGLDCNVNEGTGLIELVVCKPVVFVRLQAERNMRRDNEMPSNLIVL